jgi:YD repeat-containing protein
VTGESVYVGSDLVSELTRTWGNPNWIHPMSETLNGITTTFTPGGLGEVGTMTTNGKTTTYTYQWGRVKSITGGEPNSVVDRMINPDGTIASETVAGRTTQYAYDSLGRLTTITPPGGGTLTTINYADPVPRRHDSRKAQFHHRLRSVRSRNSNRRQQRR